MHSTSASRIVLVAVALLTTAVAAAAVEHEILVSNFQYTPSELVIEVGDTVTWKNLGGAHNVNAIGFFRCANGCDGEGGNGDPALNDWQFSRTFDEPATIDYECDNHGPLGMVGTITVIEVGGLSLTFAGECPGDITLSISGGTPSGRAALIFAFAAGTDPIPGGSCAGTGTGLSGPSPLTPLNLDAMGDGTLSATVPSGACGALLQALDVSTCTTSNVVTITSP